MPLVFIEHLFCVNTDNKGGTLKVVYVIIQCYFFLTL